MCGITAVLYHTSRFPSGGMQSDGQVQHSIRHILSYSNAKMRHRGPDGEGVFANPKVGLGMVRLAIVDEQNGQQPIWNESRTVGVVCNGEIYNHKQLRQHLESRGHVFSTQSDVEVIVHLYEEYQEACVHHLEGIFAFALWDESQGRLLVARDRCGVKPLYFVESEQYTIFSSELNTLIPFAQQQSVGEAQLHVYHLMRYCPPGETLHPNIRKLRPAEYMVFMNSGVMVKTYWKPKQALGTRTPWVNTARTLSSSAKTTVLRDLLVEAVKSQKADAVQDGILFSGGLDSTILLAMHRQCFSSVPDTYTVGFEPPRGLAKVREYDERDIAARTASHYGSTHHAQMFSAAEVLQALPELLSSLDEPIADPTAIPLWFAIRMAKQNGVKVVYSGEGMDELFLGYDVYRASYWSQALRTVPAALRTAAWKTMRRLHLPGQGTIHRSLQDVKSWYQGVGGVFTPEELTQLLTSSSTESDVRRWLKDTSSAVVDEGRVLSFMSQHDFHNWLPENTLVKSDKISMAHSVELRVPFLNQDVVEFAIALPDRDKLRLGQGKWLVRKAVKKDLPPWVLKRKKTGFPVPITAWMYDEWKDFVSSILLDPHACTRDMYRAGKVEEMFRVEERNRPRTARKLWAMLCLEFWLRNLRRQELSAEYETPKRIGTVVNSPYGPF